jgi:hypothetical protein
LDSVGLNALDWSQPWFAAVAELRDLVAARNPLAELNRCAVDRGVVTSGGLPIEFVAAAVAPAGLAYETYIAATGCVPTRLNRHDLFNALVWLAFPRTKARLNALQAAAIERHGTGSVRGALRDAATVFDESGALLLTTNPDLPVLLRERRWRDAFVERRGDWHGVRVIIFGHALMDKLVAPYKGVTAHALPIRCALTATLHQTDRAASVAIDADFRMAALQPLPVLGVPGWCRENADPIYYDDAGVFRPARSAAPVA